MILKDSEIIQYCKYPRNEDAVKQSVSVEKDMNIHVTGAGYKARIPQVTEHENDEQYRLRLTLSSPSTIPVTKIIRDELNRWTNAQGTIHTYNFKGKDVEIESEFRKKVLSQVWKGESMKYFVDNVLKEIVDQEPNGFLIVTKGRLEIGEDDILYETRDGIKRPYAVKGASLNPYIIFIQSDQIRDYLLSGNKTEYVIYKFNVSTDKDGVEVIYYRCIDDKRDVLIKNIKDDWSIVSQINHGLDTTPAIKGSLFNESPINDQVKVSQLQSLIPQLNRYLNDDSEHQFSKVLHAHPKMFSIPSKCKTCKGEGTVINDNNKRWYDANKELGDPITCPDCSGNGYVTMRNAAEVLEVPLGMPEGASPYLKGTPGGYITFPSDALEFQAEQLEKARNELIYQGTSNKNIIADKFRTATETNSNTKTLEDKIDDRLTVIEGIEEFLTSCIAKMHNDFKLKFQSCVIRYGRALYYRGEDVILQNIQNAKVGGLPFWYIAKLAEELCRTKYRYSPVELKRGLMLLKIEKYVGYSFEEIKGNPYITDEDKLYKMNFNDYVFEYESKHGRIEEQSAKDIQKIIKEISEINKKKYEDYNKESHTQSEVRGDTGSAESKFRQYGRAEQSAYSEKSNS